MIKHFWLRSVGTLSERVDEPLVSESMTKMLHCMFSLDYAVPYQNAYVAADPGKSVTQSKYHPKTVG